jgi:hypothetical protein
MHFVKIYQNLFTKYGPFKYYVRLIALKYYMINVESIFEAFYCPVTKTFISQSILVFQKAKKVCVTLSPPYSVT